MVSFVHNKNWSFLRFSSIRLVTRRRSQSALSHFRLSSSWQQSCRSTVLAAIIVGAWRVLLRPIRGVYRAARRLDWLKGPALAATARQWPWCCCCHGTRGHVLEAESLSTTAAHARRPPRLQWVGSITAPVFGHSDLCGMTDVLTRQSVSAGQTWADRQTTDVGDHLQHKENISAIIDRRLMN